MPWRAAEAAVNSLGDLAGKIVIDRMNPLRMMDGALGLLMGHTTSGGETIAVWLPSARGGKTLNQVGAAIMADTTRLPQPPVMFMAGDDAGAKASVAVLLSDLGFVPVDAGNLAKARLLKPLVMAWINQAILQGMGRNWALTLTGIRGDRPAHLGKTESLRLSHDVA